MSNELQVQIGRRIAEARRARGLTQLDLAGLTGSAVRTVQTWEAGERHPRTDTFALIAAATDRPLSWFYAAHDEKAAA